MGNKSSSNRNSSSNREIDNSLDVQTTTLYRRGRVSRNEQQETNEVNNIRIPKIKMLNLKLPKLNFSL